MNRRPSVGAAYPGTVPRTRVDRHMDMGQYGEDMRINAPNEKGRLPTFSCHFLVHVATCVHFSGAAETIAVFRCYVAAGW